MKLLATLFACTLLFPSMAIAQINRTIGDKVSDLGTFKADNNKAATRYCRSRGGNIVVKLGSKSYRCHYAQAFADTYK